MSEMSRAAKALVETRTERHAAALTLEAARSQVDQALARLGPPRATVLTLAWSEADGEAVVEARFAPPRATQRQLKALSIMMALLLAASAWAIAYEQGAMRFLLPLFTVLAILAVPFVALGLSSRRAAEESRITRAIRVALGEELPWKAPPKDDD